MSTARNTIESTNSEFERTARLYPEDTEAFKQQVSISIPAILENLPKYNGTFSLNAYGHLEIGAGQKIYTDEVVIGIMPSEVSLYHKGAFTSRSLGIEDLTTDQLYELLVGIVYYVTQAIYDQQYYN